MAATLRSAASTVAAFATGGSRYRYQPLLGAGQGESENLDDVPIEQWPKTPRRSHLRRDIILLLMSLSGATLLVYMALAYTSSPSNGLSSCDDMNDGYTCKTKQSHFWGQYSSYFSVPSDIPADIPDQCQITFAQILARHGARDPTAGKSNRYRETIDHIQKTARKFPGPYNFLQSYRYNLGADQLTVFGEQELVNSGIKFYNRYQSLAKDAIPFIRAGGQKRVIDSARNWTQGFHAARASDQTASAPDEYPYNVLIIEEGKAFNNTLSHDTCKNYETSIAADAQTTWASIFTAPITKRINRSLLGVHLDTDQTIDLMDMCPFDTVSSPLGSISRFCFMFSDENWQDYDYYQSLGKYYGFGQGNPLGATQGVGYVNELIARLTNTPVNDHTNTNSTLDDTDQTFPVDRTTTLFADFSHDNDISQVLAALRLYEATKPLSKTRRQSPEETAGFAASWTVPFASRAYFEKMKCAGQEEEYVRVLINDRVMPMKTCGGDSLGRCTLSEFVDSLSFVQSGGDWDKCFT